MSNHKGNMRDLPGGLVVKISSSSAGDAGSVPGLEAKILCASSVQFSSVTKSCPTLCDPTNRSMPGLPDHHHLPEFTQTHVH